MPSKSKSTQASKRRWFINKTADGTSQSPGISSPALQLQQRDIATLRRISALWKKIRLMRSDQRGSAVVEFVLIATPLFIPAILFFNAMQNTAKDEMSTSYLARQAVRAFATAPDLTTGHLRINYLLDEFSKLENKDNSQEEVRYRFTYEIDCSAENCLTPGNFIELKLFKFIPEVDGVVDSKNRKAKAVARTYVDKWRSNR